MRIEELHNDAPRLVSIMLKNTQFTNTLALGLFGKQISPTISAFGLVST